MGLAWAEPEPIAINRHQPRSSTINHDQPQPTQTDRDQPRQIKTDPDRPRPIAINHARSRQIKTDPDRQIMTHPWENPMATVPSPRTNSAPATLESASLELQRLFATLDPPEAQPTVAPIVPTPAPGPALPLRPEADRPDATQPAPSPRSAPRSALGPFLRACTMQGMMLGVTLVCGLGSVVVGIALAEYDAASGGVQRSLEALNLTVLATPVPATEVPLLERGLRLVRQIHLSPAQWANPLPEQLRSWGTDQSDALVLAPDDRQAAEQELARLQQEAHQILDQVVTLEQQLGIESQGRSLDLRLEQLQQRVNPTPAAQNPQVRVTLPSDALFSDSEAQLRPDAYRLLGTVIADLRRYPGAQVTIAAHTDDIGDPDANLALSFRQSHALTEYLENHLGSQYRWNTLGYGESQPLTDNSTNSNRQRNRRLEIQITP